MSRGRQYYGEQSGDIVIDNIIDAAKLAAEAEDHQNSETSNICDLFSAPGNQNSIVIREKCFLNIFGGVIIISVPLFPPALN